METTQFSQISAHITEGTKIKLDRLARARGLRKAFVLEQALQYHFRALEELPDEALLPPRLVLSNAEFEQVLNAIANPPVATQAMQELMNGNLGAPSAQG